MYLYEGRESCHYIAQSVSVQARDLVKTGWKFSFEESDAGLPMFEPFYDDLNVLSIHASPLGLRGLADRVT